MKKLKEKSEVGINNQKIPKTTEVNGGPKRLEGKNLIHLKEGEKEWTLELKPMNFEGENI